MISLTCLLFPLCVESLTLQELSSVACCMLEGNEDSAGYIEQLNGMGAKLQSVQNMLEYEFALPLHKAPCMSSIFKWAVISVGSLTSGVHRL